VAITNAPNAPESTILNETHKAAVKHLGDRLRVRGRAQLSGFDLRFDEIRRRTLEFDVADLLPKGGDAYQAEFWNGLRPLTPKGSTMPGPMGLPNMSLATGHHGTLEWTTADGTCRLLANCKGHVRRRLTRRG